MKLIGNHADSSGKRFNSLQDAFPLFKESLMSDWGFRGPRAVKEYLQSTRGASNDLASYYLQWLQHSGANPRTALAHEHRNILEVLRLGICRDQKWRGVDSCSGPLAHRETQGESPDSETNPLVPEEMGHGTRSQKQQHEDGATGFTFLTARCLGGPGAEHPCSARSAP